MAKCSFCGEVVTTREMSRHRTEKHPQEPVGSCFPKTTQSETKQQTSLSSQIAELEQQNQALHEATAKLQDRIQAQENLIQRERAKSQEVLPLLNIGEKLDRIKSLMTFSVRERTEEEHLLFVGRLSRWGDVFQADFTLSVLVENRKREAVKLHYADLAFLEQVVMGMKDVQQRQQEIETIIKDLQPLWSQLEWVENYISITHPPLAPTENKQLESGKEEDGETKEGHLPTPA